MRVFISSTFRDMHAERDELVKRIFPQLRKLCEQRGVAWAEVDLRWGITDEQSAEGQVLPICLAEIKNCRPYFIGLLGERYGWVPERIPQDLIDQENWLADLKDHSVTELEILHGVLNNPKMAEHAYFYFRDSAYIDGLPVDTQAEFCESPTREEISEFGYEKAVHRAEKRAQNLTALKERIRSSGFPVKENYPDPETLGKLVLQDLTALIDRLYPESEQLDLLDREEAEHEAFAASRAKVYIGRQEYFDALDAHVRGDDQPLVVLGESGSGKSALLANWALHYREAHPDDLLLMHFIGGSPYSSDWATMLRRILGRMKRHFDIREEIPEKPDSLRTTFANWLNMISAKGRVVLILDALNQLEDRDGAPDLVWLPPVIPRNVRMVFSTLPGRALTELTRRGWQTMQVEMLTLEERKQLISDYLALSSKTLSLAQIERIANSVQAANPLYLRALLEELRVFGVYEQLEERIGYYLAAQTIDGLFERILARYEADYERERPGLVHEAMSLFWAARHGLSEVELLELLGKEKPLPHAYWSPLYLASEQALVSRSGLFGFFHNYLRKAVQNRYLPSEEEQRGYHLRLADYFDNREPGTRRADEEPWQLYEAKAWERLYRLLIDLRFFDVAWQVNESEIRWYWAQIENQTSFTMVTGYKEVLNAPGEFKADLVLKIGRLLTDGHPDEAMKLFEALVEHCRRTRDLANLTSAIGNLAINMMERGGEKRAMEFVKEQEQLCRESGDEPGLAFSLMNQGHLMRLQNNAQALALYRECESIHRKSGNKVLLQEALGNQAEVGYEGHILDMDSAMALLKEQEGICREVGNQSGLANSFGIQATILADNKHLLQAVELLQKAEQIYRELGNQYYLAVALQNRGLLLVQSGQSLPGYELLFEALAITEEFGFTGLQDNINHNLTFL
jgi:tetratricopeptide (TPR) repeat protein